jgi:hypothetical protein
MPDQAEELRCRLLIPADLAEHPFDIVLLFFERQNLIFFFRNVLMPNPRKASGRCPVSMAVPSESAMPRLMMLSSSACSLEKHSLHPMAFLITFRIARWSR